jgi:hypothetical protein
MRNGHLPSETNGRDCHLRDKWRAVRETGSKEEKRMSIALQRTHLLHPSARNMRDGEITSDDHPSGYKGLGYAGARQFHSA